MQTKVTITDKLQVAIDPAWAAVRSFGQLDVCFPSMETCAVEGSGVGAVRHLRLVGGLGEIADHLVALDDPERRLTYRRTESPFPVTAYTGTVEVFESFDTLAVVVWTVDFESTAEDSGPVADLLEAAISDGLAGMGADLRGGSA
jgi:hypothetical protein